MEFTATVSRRSSRGAGGPPGEAEVLRLNPQRRSLILEATGWSQLFDGTLNLEVAQGIVEQLLFHQPLINEPGSSVTYPPPYQDIPRKRGGYLYYPAIVSRRKVTAPALIRRAINPLPTRVEAFSDRCLRDFLQVVDDDEVACRVGT
jgi:CTP-dependent riboflavin kinase